MNKLSAANMSEIENIIGYTFTDKSLLRTAFTHSSYAHTNSLEDNERMEFWGDAILGMICAEYLYVNCKSKNAGELSKLRASIVSASGLNVAIEEMGLIRFLMTSGGAEDIKYRSHKIKSNLFEAILCAIYIDGGYEKAKDFVLRHISNSNPLDAGKFVDYKTALQEYCNSERLDLRYIKVGKSGPDNNPTFKYEVHIDGRFVADGCGGSIRQAETACAKRAMQVLSIKSNR
ncbi:MAG: ribonuclease III [Corallococcus sp.]|nr:ribonuclease III [Corallococcus sp.]